jgi:hypothetical protein
VNSAFNLSNACWHSSVHTKLAFFAFFAFRAICTFFAFCPFLSFFVSSVSGLATFENPSMKRR